MSNQQSVHISKLEQNCRSRKMSRIQDMAERYWSCIHAEDEQFQKMFVNFMDFIHEQYGFYIKEKIEKKGVQDENENIWNVLKNNFLNHFESCRKNKGESLFQQSIPLKKSLRSIRQIIDQSIGVFANKVIQRIEDLYRQSCEAKSFDGRVFAELIQELDNRYKYYRVYRLVYGDEGDSKELKVESVLQDVHSAIEKHIKSCIQGSEVPYYKRNGYWSYASIAASIYSHKAIDYNRRNTFRQNADENGDVHYERYTEISLFSPVTQSDGEEVELYYNIDEKGNRTDKNTSKSDSVIVSLLTDEQIDFEKLILKMTLKVLSLSKKPLETKIWMFYSQILPVYLQEDYELHTISANGRRRRVAKIGGFTENNSRNHDVAAKWAIQNIPVNKTVGELSKEIEIWIRTNIDVEFNWGIPAETDSLSKIFLKKNMNPKKISERVKALNREIKEQVTASLAQSFHWRNMVDSYEESISFSLRV